MTKSFNATKGFTLIEVLVSLFVLSVGLLGLAALQGTSLAFNTDSYTRTQATLIAYDIADKMRANPGGVTSGSYDIPSASDAATAISAFGTCLADTTCDCSGAGASCNSSTLALYDLGMWYATMAKAEVLPGAADPTQLATIGRDAANLVTITIRWFERDVSMQQEWKIQM